MSAGVYLSQDIVNVLRATAYTMLASGRMSVDTRDTITGIALAFGISLAAVLPDAADVVPPERRIR